ncbi:uncharacterized protein [Muntiacus reevesi]|uniref:uncharacterized protein n=1 Tax=Muntiacus reevesi TaxID=9886 RepID=UPI0033078672
MGEPTPGRTDPDFVNDVSEKEQRRGAKVVPGYGHQEHINIPQLWENVFQEHQTLKEKELEMGPKASHGYGGKFGVEQDRMDKLSAMSISQSSPSSACSLTPSGGLEASLVSSGTEWTSHPGRCGVVEDTDCPGPGHVTILSRTRVSCSWCISGGDSSSTAHWSPDQREGSCQEWSCWDLWHLCVSTFGRTARFFDFPFPPPA